MPALLVAAAVGLTPVPAPVAHCVVAALGVPAAALIRRPTRRRRAG